MQHKAQLGHKTISKVTVFRPETDDDLMFVDPSLVFHVEDVPESPRDQVTINPTAREGEVDDIVRNHKL